MKRRYVTESVFAITFVAMAMGILFVHRLQVAARNEELRVVYEARPDMELNEEIPKSDVSPTYVEKSGNTTTVTFGATPDGSSGQRSGRWPTVMHHFKQNEYYDAQTATWEKFHDNIDRGSCRCCGSTLDLNVHHIVSYHDKHELELDPNNLVTLCREHHFRIGHKNNWKDSNPNVCADCDAMRVRLPRR